MQLLLSPWTRGSICCRAFSSTSHIYSASSLYTLRGHQNSNHQNTLTKPQVQSFFSSTVLRRKTSPSPVEEEHQQHASPSNTMSSQSKSKKPLAVPRPSASVLVVSPRNEILLLHRVQTSSSFPSAHVFPGGNVDAFHDGIAPGPDEPGRHMDGPTYRLAAIRETFEESGILLARNAGFGRLIELSDEVKEDGRKKVHDGEVQFSTWVAGQGGSPDVDALIPFTRWITPATRKKRFTTQMYVYFLPLDRPPPSAAPSAPEDAGPLFDAAAAVVSTPTPDGDGGVEATEARFRPASRWLDLARGGDVILFPPQFFLLSMVSRFLDAGQSGAEQSREQLAEGRRQLKRFLKDETAEWGELVICPAQFMKSKTDGRTVLGLEKPGPELRNSGRKGVEDYIVLVNFKEEGPKNVEVKERNAFLEEDRNAGDDEKSKL